MTRPQLSRMLDAATSKLLRYDLSRTDVVKWVDFARQILLLVLISVVTTAGLSAFLSTKQAEGLLRESLAGQARAIAGAVARAAFVPMTLEDADAVGALVESHRTVEHLGSLRVFDASRRLKHELVQRDGSADVAGVEIPILAPADPGWTKTPRGAPIGHVQVGMRTDWIASKARTIALTNVAVSGGLAFAIFAVGMLVIRHLVDRTRELVGEARLVEQVKRANEELEAFSYSVAHDLRAPVRAIDGFSQALLEGYKEKLDEEGQDYLQRVRAGSKRMGLLIDDLLNLSRVTRSPMRRQKFDLSTMAREIAGQLKASQPERAVEFIIERGLWADGDPNLMRAALENLLGNSWKYTKRRARATIEFGRAALEGPAAYYVRDDGAGFDMAFSKKLFKAFSRLHSPAEFEGTGIGLATVHRIIARHGGRIWGEGEPEKGATFYFTLNGG